MMFFSGHCSEVNPHLPNEPFHPYQLDESISNFRGVWCAFSFYSISNRNSCKQTVKTLIRCRFLRCLHCLPMSQKWDARLICDLTLLFNQAFLHMVFCSFDCMRVWMGFND